MSWINWIVSNGTDLVQIWLGLIGVASIVIRITPNVRDDLWLKRYLRFAGKFIALNRK